MYPPPENALEARATDRTGNDRMFHITCASVPIARYIQQIDSKKYNKKRRNNLPTISSSIESPFPIPARCVYGARARINRVFPGSNSNSSSKTQSPSNRYGQRPSKARDTNSNRSHNTRSSTSEKTSKEPAQRHRVIKTASSRQQQPYRPELD